MRFIRIEITVSMKKIIFLIYLFGSILIPLGLGWLVCSLAPPEFVLNKDILSVNQAALKNSLFPNFRSKEPFSYPGILMGLTGKEEDNRFWLLICEDQKRQNPFLKTMPRR